MLIPVTASNIPELLLADPRFEHSTRNVVFWHMKISQILWLFQLLQINCSSAVSSLTNGISSMQNTPHWEPYGRIHFHITGSYTIDPEAIPRSPMDWATLHLSPAVMLASTAHFSVFSSDHPGFFPYIR